MRDNPDHHDAELMLRLYDLRRDEKLRQARAWLIQEFQAESQEDILKRYPRGTRENDYFRMASTYWDMAASIVNHGLIKEDFFFESNSELYAVWIKLSPVVPSAREAAKNPSLYRNLELAAEKYERWLSGRAPEAANAMRERIRHLGVKK